MEPSNKSLTIAASILGIALILSVALGAHAFSKAKRLGNTMAVTGSAEKLVDSDTVKWSVSLARTVSPSEQLTVGRLLNADRVVFMNLIKTIGLDESSVSIQPMNIFPNMEYNSQTGQSVLVGYTASQMLVIESSKVNEVGTLAQNASATLGEKSVNASTQSIEYYYGKLTDVKLELLTEATKNARARAEAIISGGGGHLGQVRSADTGVFQITAVNSADLSDYGTYDTSAMKKKVTAVVHVTFGLK